VRPEDESPEGRGDLQQDLRLSQKRFWDLIETLPEPYFQANREEEIVYLNRAAVDQLGYSSVDDLRGRHLRDFYVDPAEREAVVEELYREGRIQNFEIRLRDAAGKTRNVLVSSQLIRDHAGEVTGIEGVARDITELVSIRGELASKVEEITEAYARLKEAQAKMIHQEKMASLGTLMAGVAHEITNPVNYIFGNLSFLEKNLEDLLHIFTHETDLDPSRPPRWLRRARDLITDLAESARDSCEGLERLREVVGNLRAFSRVGSPKLDPVDLEQALDGTLRFLAFEYGDRVTVERRYAGLPPVPCNASEMNQVFMNLLTNAFQAAGVEGSILLETGKTPGGVYIKITDSGEGIPDEIRDSVFEPFFTTKPEGVGLGLSISYDIVRRHGGDIGLASSRGRGSTFTVTLPEKALAS
jgi:PAS domain S-box-containing protein